jgi:TolB-like protein
MGFRQYQAIDMAGWKGRGRPVHFARLLDAIAGGSGQSETGTTDGIAEEGPTPPFSDPLRGLSALPKRQVVAVLAFACLVAALAFLLWYGRHDRREPRMLAVLPFHASNGADGNLADGLSEELLSQLSENGKLRVIGRTSAWQYKDKSVDLRTVGRQLGADYLVEGNVARAGNKMRIAVSLVRASDGSTMWSRVYTGSYQGTLQIRSAIAAGVVAALGVPEKAAASAYKPNDEAYSLYLRAKGLFRNRTQITMQNARTLMLEAMRIDPKFAPAWAYAGGITTLLGEKTFLVDPSRPDGRSMTPREALEHALKLDPNLADAHGFMGWIGGAWTVEGAGHLQRAVELQPNDPQILYWYGQGLSRQGNYGRYAEVNRKAAALDPLWPLPVAEAASASLWAGDQAAVQRYLQRIRAGNPSGAVEVESSLAAQQGDASRVIELALRNKGRDRQISTDQAAIRLIELGFEREGRLIGQFGPQDVLYNSEFLPGRAALLKLAVESAEDFDYVGAFYQLRRHGRYGDIVALYDAARGNIGEIRQATFANRAIRMELGGAVAQALQKMDRNAEAAQLLRLTDDADQAIMVSEPMPPYDWIMIAANDAVGGKREEAIELLQQAASRGYLMPMPIDGKIDPIWENLRGDPRFQRLARAALAHVQKERREVVALGLL